MPRMNLPAYLCAIALTVCAAAQAREGNTLKDELRIYTADIATQCKSVQDQLEDFKVETDPLTGFTLKDAVQSLCVCIPGHLQTMAATFTQKDLAKDVSADEVLSRFNPQVIDKCAGEQIQAMYGAQCPERFKLADLDVPHYCACMKKVVSVYSDAETAAIAAAAADYLPAAAEAEKNDDPLPKRPPVLEAYYRADLGCKGTRKGFESLKP